MVAARGRRFFGWREISAALIVLAVYSVCLSRMPTHTFWSPDEGCKFMQTKTIRWDGGIDYALPYRGQRIDPETRFYAGHTWGRSVPALYPLQQVDGTFRFHWPIWFSLIVKVPVELFGPIGGFLVAMLAGWLVALLSGVLAADIDRNLVAPAILVVGLATPIWFFSLCFWEHTSGVAFALLAILVLVRGRATLSALLLSLPLAAAAVMMRIELLGLAAALCATFVVVGLLRAAPESASAAVTPAPRRTPSRLPTTLALIVLVIVLLAAINFTLTGRHAIMLLHLPSRLARLEYLPRVLGMLAVAPYWSEDNLLTDADWRVGLAGAVCCLLAPFTRRRWIEVPLTIAGLAGFAVYTGHLATTSKYYRSLQGLLPIAPFMILATHGVHHAMQQRESRFFVFAVAGVAYAILGILGLTMIYVNEYGQLSSLGLAWGQRYLLTLYPLLTVLSLAGLQAFWRSAQGRISKVAVMALATALVVIGVKFELRGFYESRGTRDTLAAWQKAMETQGPIITDVWWLPAGVAAYYVREPAYAVGWRHNVADWLGMAADNGVTSFTFASLTPVQPSDFGNPPPRKIVRRSARVVRGLYLTKFSFLSGARLPPARR